MEKRFASTKSSTVFSKVLESFAMLEFRLATLLTVLTFGLILLGGIVHGTGSSLACPDWPLCFGSLFPEMKGSVAIEHSHRLLAAAIGLGTIGLAILLRKNSKLRWMGLAAVLIVILQGILGGITVLYQLPDAISTAHLGTSMLFFTLLLLIASRLRGKTTAASRQASPFLFYSLAFFVYLQNLLGAFVRHTGSGIVCPDIPFCRGEFWPTPFGPTQLHMMHRWNGLLLLALFLVAIALSWRQSQPIERTILIVLFSLLLVQIGIGVASVLGSLALLPITLHLGVGTILFAMLVWLGNRRQGVSL